MECQKNTAGDYGYYDGPYDAPTAPYYDKYSFGATTNDAAAIKRTKLGEGIREVWTGTTGVSWYGDYAYVANTTNPWAYRGGGYYAAGKQAGGLFASNHRHGLAIIDTSSRIIIAENNK